ncbi:D-2-hydroxyacid dehydrogenase [Bosea sp. (in: a-proteobacteria)]|uniref:D-2-hydroxyacid dehydrogenase n=1 Tax=Bosea sp. (in: a-proteobacteria) TaxID=1871050 RepID=UPI00261D5F00|nr:D-2-hydroxyacid dehydrogenase [Bosea sp. (in: a-proteobacteria)]MCO5090026.1 D-2-hydroxyacid dehydrogenase [Bosea sp. (in: a-proteobacteria)]
MHRIVFLDRGTIAPQVVVRRPAFEHVWQEHEKSSSGQILERAEDATIIITNKVDLRTDLLAKLPRLKLVAVAATGYDCIDVAAARERGIAVCNIRGYAKTTVPEHTFALILSLSRAIVPYHQSVRAGRWQEAGQFCYFDFPIFDLAGKRLGVIGGGVLGTRVAELGRAFGMDVVVYDPKPAAPTPSLVPLAELIRTSDVITLHCPLTPETAGIIDAAQFRRMEKKPLLINTARGGLIVENDLYEALTGGLVAGAALDVTLPEPPPPGGSFMRLAALPNVVVTPHTAWSSVEAQQALADQLIDNVDAFVQGQPRNVV